MSNDGFSGLSYSAYQQQCGRKRKANRKIDYDDFDDDDDFDFNYDGNTNNNFNTRLG